MEKKNMLKTECYYHNEGFLPGGGGFVIEHMLEKSVAAMLLRSNLLPVLLKAMTQ